MSSTESNSRQPRGKDDIPIINRVAAGYPMDFTDLDYPPSVADEYVRCPDIDDPQAFAARVVGDSMEPDYHEGDIVVFAPNTPAESGQDCFVRLDTGETTFKRVFQDDPATLRLQPLSEKHPAHIVGRREVTGLWPVVARIERSTTDRRVSDISHSQQESS